MKRRDFLKGSIVVPAIALGVRALPVEVLPSEVKLPCTLAGIVGAVDVVEWFAFQNTKNLQPWRGIPAGRAILRSWEAHVDESLRWHCKLFIEPCDPTDITVYSHGKYVEYSLYKKLDFNLFAPLLWEPTP
jgi:hypothetical protein